MTENAIGLPWHRDGWLFEPLANGRVRIDFTAKRRRLTADATARRN